MRLVSAFSLCLVFIAVCWSTSLPENTPAVETATFSAAERTGNQSNAASGSVAIASGSEISSAPCPSGETGKPDVQEFSEVLVLIRKPDLVEKVLFHIYPIIIIILYKVKKRGIADMCKSPKRAKCERETWSQSFSFLTIMQAIFFSRVEVKVLSTSTKKYAIVIVTELNCRMPPSFS